MSAAASGSKHSKSGSKHAAAAATGSHNAFATLAEPELDDVASPADVEEKAGDRSRAAQMEALVSGAKALKEPIVWVDLEMTGLEVDTCSILEIAVIITDGKLTQVIEGPEIAIHHSDAALDAMNAWCIEHHGKSGLTQRCRDSKVSLAEAEQRVLEFVQKYTKEKWAPLAGNSVHCDRAFLERYMPKLTAHLHYRIIDVSSVKELCKRWYKKEFTHAPRKALAHTALSDIRESIQELRYYQQTIFKKT